MNFNKRVNGSWTDAPHYIHKTDTDILTTLPADIYANDTTATVGLKGNMEQTGTPTPDNPIMPQGTGERSSNLVEGYLSGCNINASGSLISNAEFNMFIAKVEQGKTYCLDATITIAGYFSTMPTVGSVSYDAQRLSLTLSPFTAPIDGYLVYRKASSEKKAMMNEGNELLPYEPYGYKIPISSANTTTPVYLGEVETTRKINKVVLTGTERIGTSSNPNYYIVYFDEYPIGRTDLISTHFAVANYYGDIAQGETRFADDNRLIINYDSGSGGVSNFISWLQQQYANGTPVTVWYVLATETTGIVNEPLCKIGDYADTVSGITIPTIAGANTLSIGTALQPSEVGVNYKGWHPVADVHERDNGAWD